MATWNFAFCGFFILWGIFAFLHIVSLEIRRQKSRLEAEKQMLEDQAKRQALLPVATATPIASNLPRDSASGQQS